MKWAFLLPAAIALVTSTAACDSDSGSRAGTLGRSSLDAPFASRGLDESEAVDAEDADQDDQDQDDLSSWQEESDAQAWDDRGYPCTDDCSGHDAGYEWAGDNGIDNPDDCGGNSQSFIEGCQAYAEELEEE